MSTTKTIYIVGMSPHWDPEWHYTPDRAFEDEAGARSYQAAMEAKQKLEASHSRDAYIFWKTPFVSAD